MTFCSSTKPLFSIAVLAFAMTAVSACADWPFARGGANSTGVAGMASPDTPRVAWTYSAGETALEATPVVIDGIAYFGDADGAFHAVRIRDGSQVWRVEFDETVFLSPAAAAADAIYAPDMDGIVRCLDSQKGVERWKFEANSEVYGGPLLYERADELKLLLVPTEVGKLFALNADNGELVWEFQIEAPLRCTPTIVGEVTLLAGCDGKLHTVDVNSGQEIGNCDISNPTGNTAAVHSGVAYFGTESGEFLAIDATRPMAPSVSWTFRDPKQGQGVRTAAAVSSSVIVFANQAKTVYGLDPSKGNLTWRHRTRSRVDTSPLGFRDGRFLIATSRGRIILLDGKSGEALWNYNVGGSFVADPIATDNVVLLPNTDGNLICLGKGAADER